MYCTKKSKFPARFISQKSDKTVGRLSGACSVSREGAIDDKAKKSGFFCVHDDVMTILLLPIFHFCNRYLETKIMSAPFGIFKAVRTFFLALPKSLFPGFCILQKAV